jgi:hypothetical protein
MGPPYPEGSSGSEDEKRGWTGIEGRSGTMKGR